MAGKDAAREGHSERVMIATVTGARGLKGEVRIKVFAEDADALTAYGPVTDEAGERVFRILVTGEAKGQLIARIEGVEDRDGAEALKGQGLYVARSALPEPEEDEYYHADLVGLRAETVDGKALGTVRAVHDYGAGVSLEIDGGPPGLVMVPFTRAVVPVVDLKGGRVAIEPPPGLLEPPEAAAQEQEEDETGRSNADGNGNET